MHFNQQSWHRKTTMVTATMIWETQTIWYISNLLQNLKNRKVSFFSYFQDLYSTLCLWAGIGLDSWKGFGYEEGPGESL